MKGPQMFDVGLALVHILCYIYLCVDEDGEFFDAFLLILNFVLSKYMV